MSNGAPDDKPMGTLISAMLARAYFLVELGI